MTQSRQSDGHQQHVFWYMFFSPERDHISGKERDAESGLDYFGARYYSGPQGRFTYSNANPDAYQISLWGSVFTFNDSGEVFYPRNGLVGHLRR